jgi:hypothetical protein
MSAELDLPPKAKHVLGHQRTSTEENSNRRLEKIHKEELNNIVAWRLRAHC